MTAWQPWLDQAESDLQAAKVLSVGRCHSQSVWFASQAVEKAHKAILLALGLRADEHLLKKLGHETSAIAALLPDALHQPTDPSIAADVAMLEERGRTSRYPTIRRAGSQPPQWIAPDQETTDSVALLSTATRLVEWCKARIQRAEQAVKAMGPPAP
jgi:HEPN domain-containing protein